MIRDKHTLAGPFPWQRRQRGLARTIDVLTLAHYEIADAAARAVVAVATVPAAADALAQRPTRLPGRNGDDVPDDLVPRHARVRNRVRACIADVLVADDPMKLVQETY